jgi:amino acid permease
MSLTPNSVTCLLSFFKGFDAFMPFAYKTFITHYIGIPIYVFGYLGYKREYERLRSSWPATRIPHPNHRAGPR